MRYLLCALIKGIIKGNPRIAIIAEGCCAFAAMAAKKLNTKLKLIPPKQLIPKNKSICCNGLPNNKVKSNKLNPLISTINILLYISLESIKSTGLAMV